jgi:hypothetical protein
MPEGTRSPPSSYQHAVPPPTMQHACPYRKLCSRCYTTACALRPSQPDRLRRCLTQLRGHDDDLAGEKRWLFRSARSMCGLRMALGGSQVGPEHVGCRAANSLPVGDVLQASGMTPPRRSLESVFPAPLRTQACRKQTFAERPPQRFGGGYRRMLAAYSGPSCPWPSFRRFTAYVSQTRENGSGSAKASWVSPGASASA